MYGFVKCFFTITFFFSEPRQPVEPRKPPTYTPEPPEYSLELPEAHFRPQTASDFVNMNTRFRPGNITNNSNLPGVVAATLVSGVHPGHQQANHRRQRRTRHDVMTHIIPEDGGISPPPPYREQQRGPTPAPNRHRRVIRTHITNGAVHQSVETNVDIPEEQPTDANENVTLANVNIPNAPEANRALEPVSDTSTNRVESRAETVTRILQPTRAQHSSNVPPRPPTYRHQRRSHISDEHYVRDEVFEELIHI